MRRSDKRRRTRAARVAAKLCPDVDQEWAAKRYLAIRHWYEHLGPKERDRQIAAQLRHEWRKRWPPDEPAVRVG